jgi:hypothetical protein
MNLCMNRVELTKPSTDWSQEHMTESPESDIRIEKRHRVWQVVWRKPGYPPRMLMTHVALNEAQRAEYRRELTLAAKLRKAAAIKTTRT